MELLWAEKGIAGKAEGLWLVHVRANQGGFLLKDDVPRGKVPTGHHNPVIER